MLDATRDNIVNRALELTDWFTPDQLYAVAGHKEVSTVLNELVRAGDIETCWFKNGTKKFRWING